MKKFKKAWDASLAEINYWHLRIRALEFARGAGDCRRTQDIPKASELRDWLFERELEAYRKLFMWAIMLTDDEKKTARRMACERFLKEDASIMEYLSPVGEHPGSWESNMEDEFRKEIEELRKE
mgnify:CR=1 FL=1